MDTLVSRGDGGAAFPVIPPVHEPSGESLMGWPMPDRGMTLRDYFAAKAMQGIVASISQACPLNVPNDVRLAYEIADAMLAARGDS